MKIFALKPVEVDATLVWAYRGTVMLPLELREVFTCNRLSEPIGCPGLFFECLGGRRIGRAPGGFGGLFGTIKLSICDGIE